MGNSTPFPIKVMADYGCHALWWDSAHPVWSAWNGEMGDIDPVELGVTTSLAGELRAWAEKFDSMLNWEDPGRTYICPELEAAFDMEGRILAKRLAEELGAKAIVRYWRDLIDTD